MEAIVINIQEHPARTPHQVIRSFLMAHQPDAVELLLWEVFGAYAVSPRKNLLGTDIRDTDVAGLFDGLTSLVAAVHALKDYFETG